MENEYHSQISDALLLIICKREINWEGEYGTGSREVRKLEMWRNMVGQQMQYVSKSQLYFAAQYAGIISICIFPLDSMSICY